MVLSNAQLLLAPDFTTILLLAEDASDIGLGAVLLQEDQCGIEKPVSYFSQTLKKAS